MKTITNIIKALTSSLIISVLLIGLTGCAGMDSSFDCNVKSGGMCASMDSVNRLADSGHFSGDPVISSVAAKSRAGALSTALHYSQATGYPVRAYKGHPIHTNAQIERIWFGPYEDAQKNYHEPSIIYTVLSQGHWIGEPVKAVKAGA